MLNPGGENIKSSTTMKLSGTGGVANMFSGANRKSTIAINHMSSTNSGETTPRLGAKLNFQSKGPSLSIPVNDFGFGHIIPMEEEVAN